MILGRFVAIVSAVFVFLLVSCQEESESMVLSATAGQAMGTTWMLAIRSEDAKAYQFSFEIKALLNEQEKRFSNWSEESEVSLLERGEGEASSEMKKLLELCERVKKESEGSFDVSWDGGLDLGGAAKGWAVDQVGELLESRGVDDFVFELGGEVVARGNGSREDGWDVQIEAPEPLVSRMVRTVTLRDEALATTGNYHQPAHLKDGRTGEVVGGAFHSVTVVMPTCAEADAWATALFVLGEEPEGFKGDVYWNN